MSKDWKMILYDYAMQHNEMTVQGYLGAMDKLVDDMGFLEREDRMLRKIAREWKRRGIKPQRSQTYAKIMRAHEEEETVTADLKLQVKLTYIQWNKQHEEEKVLTERITLRRDHGSWRIVNVQPHIAERQPVLGSNAGSAGSHGAQLSSAVSRPLLNTHLLYGSQHDPGRNGSRKSTYDRHRAKEYADKYWNSANPGFLEFEVDCTNYVSQCLLAGGAPMNYTGRREAGWWYQGRKGNREWWSYSWSVSNALQHYLMSSRSGLQAELVHSPYELDLGDVIIYDWDGDGAYQHSTIVTGFDAAGEPLVNAHTANSRARLWSYRDSPAWTDRTRYRFFHIADYF